MRRRCPEQIHIFISYFCQDEMEKKRVDCVRDDDDDDENVKEDDNQRSENT